MIKVGIIGGAGYTAGELIRLLINHPDVEIRFTDLMFTDELPLDEIDVLFFCTAHGDTRKFMESHNLPEELKIIDLSMDYRIASEDHDFVYGLPELNRRTICHSKHIANPGCFATCIQLALLPLAKHLMLKGDITVNAITGSTGAGVKPGATTHFSWRNNNLSIYKPFTHQHLPEIRQSLKQLQNSFDADITFIPYRGDFARGIFATTIVKTKVELPEIVKMYEEYYAEDSFVHIVEKSIDLKQVVNTNKCLIHLEKHEDKLLIVSCIDNLGCQRPGGPQHEPDVQLRRNGRAEIEAECFLNEECFLLNTETQRHRDLILNKELRVSVTLCSKLYYKRIMKLFDVYPLFDINIVKGKGCHVWDDKGEEYLDLHRPCTPALCRNHQQASSYIGILLKLGYQQTATGSG